MTEEPMATTGSQTPAAPRPSTAIDNIADAYVQRLAELHPVLATSVGINGFDDQMTDLSPAGFDARIEATRDALDQIGKAPVHDDTDAVTVAAMHERLGLEIELHEAGETLASLNNIASPLQEVRMVFDLMPTATTQDWENIASRLDGVGTAIDGYIESLREAANRGLVTPIRQVEEGIKQAEELAGNDSFFRKLTTGPGVDSVLDESGTCALVRKDLEYGARTASEAYGRLAGFLRTELAPQAPQDDAAGAERYALWSRYFLGARVDLHETYEWGLAELERIIDEQQRTAALIVPSGNVQEAVEHLDRDPARKLIGTDALRSWMQETSDAAIEALHGTHFDIPGPVRTLECMIAPTQDGGIYYTGPSDDFSRPGRMWWSVPPTVAEFNTWRELTTVYHEGVPGHHLQVGQAVFRKDTLNSWRRLLSWSSGHGEGWALYAERLMAELGFMDDPANMLGMLDAQRMRAARVVLDIGVHLRLPAPQQWGGGTWDAAKAWEFLRANVNMPEDFIRFELNRYLGWPGQAPSYKVGQRLWEQARDNAQQAARTQGRNFDLRQFHERALNMGSVGLDVLNDVLSK